MSKPLAVSSQLLQQIEQHAISSYPNECCGLLIGHSTAEFDHVLDLMLGTNQRTDSAHNRFLIDPRDYLQAERRAAKLGQGVVGVYHSHPDHPARPSDYDQAQALPNMAYLILSVVNGKIVDHRSFRLRDDRLAFDEQLVIVGT